MPQVRYTPYRYAPHRYASYSDAPHYYASYRYAPYRYAPYRCDPGYVSVSLCEVGKIIFVLPPSFVVIIFKVFTDST